MGLIGSSNHNSIWCLDMEGQHVPLVRSGLWLPLQGTIVNRTYGTHKNLDIYLFLLTIVGPIYYGRVPRKPVSPRVLSIARLCGLGRSQLSRDHGNIPNPAQNLGKNPRKALIFWAHRGSCIFVSDMILFFFFFFRGRGGFVRDSEGAVGAAWR